MSINFKNLRRLLRNDFEHYIFHRDITLAEVLSLEQFPDVKSPYVDHRRHRLFQEMQYTFNEMIFEEPPMGPTNWKNDIDLLALNKFKLLNTNK